MNLVMFEAEVIDEILGKEPKENTEFLGTPSVAEFPIFSREDRNQGFL